MFAPLSPTATLAATTMHVETPFGTLLSVALCVIGVAMLLGLFRLLRGRSLADRVVALDLMASLSVGAMTALSMLTGESVYLDAALILALIAFLGTVGFASLIGRAEEDIPTEGARKAARVRGSARSARTVPAAGMPESGKHPLADLETQMEDPR